MKCREVGSGVRRKAEGGKRKKGVGVEVEVGLEDGK